MRKLLIANIILLLTITSCGYFDDDRTEYEVPIAGNILLQKQRGSQEVLLVLRETPEASVGLVENVDSVFYDSSNGLILVKSIINDYNNSYYQIMVLDTLGTSVTSAVRKKQISKQDFITRTSQTAANWTRSNK